MRAYLRLACGCGLAALCVGNAWAQDGAAPASGERTVQTAQDQSDSGGLGDIVVTATRRETNLQDTPLAVTAIDQRLIRQSSPRDLGDVSVFVPNFNASRLTGFNAASFAIRGIGQTNIIIYFEPPVAVLVDDFVLSSVQTQLLDTFDVSQVEVLRGPQGTLFGRNTTGGAVVVKTKRPNVDAFGAEGQFSVGSFNSYELKGALNVPIIEGQLALRVVGAYAKSDGYMRNGACYGPITGFVPSKWDGLAGCGEGERVGGTEVFNARVKLLWEPSDTISALFQYEILRDNSESPAAVGETPPNQAAVGNPGDPGYVPPLFFLFNAIGFPQNGGDPLDNAGVTKRDDRGINVGKGHTINVDGYYANIDVDAGAGTFTSVTGYRFQRSRLGSTYPGFSVTHPDGEILSLFDANRDDNRRTFQQELRFASDFGGPFEFVAGGFFQRERVKFCVPQFLGFLDIASGPPGFSSWNQEIYTLCNSQRSRSVAVFAEGTYKFTDTLTLTVGGRYSWDRKTWMGRQQVFYQQLNGGFDPTFGFDDLNGSLDAADFDRFPDGVVTVRRSWDEPSYRASLGWQATPDVFLYGTYAHGYKSGGFNDQIGTFSPFGTNLDAFAEAAQPTDPEFADSFEIGVKSELFDRRVRLNVTGFYVKYDDLQRQIVRPIVVNGAPFQVSTYFNASKADVKGIEAETTIVPVDGLTLRGVLGYQDAKCKEYVTPIPAGYDLCSAGLERAPKWQWTLDGAYQFPVADKAKITLNATLTHSSRSLFSQSITDPRENTFLDARTLLNASITVADIDDKYYLRAIGRNLTDERYRTASLTVGGLWVFSLYGPPRYYGLEAGFRF